ncbi:SGNH/GDSL hydrolase family protein [Novosphingobium profundi]|uniref:GDSL-type esterase/lipase family protein n=1 Tax=Novosphingobium profundi TaxID=1774954 RepID=UPI001BD9C377|nr:GDSL-type esterase/lipase family protein [Novosphingobium profundi]MBT0669221.1 SGNH/GDSL hydrolase family protein [Novosphingobium profundi]
MQSKPTMRKFAAALLLLVAALWGTGAFAAEAGDETWVASWARAMRSEDEPLAAEAIAGSVIRTYVPLSTGGTQVRLRFTNRFGHAPLVLAQVRVARPAGAPGEDRIDPASSAAVTFGGKAQVTIPAGAYLESDPVAFAVAGLDRLAVSFRMPEGDDTRTLAVMPLGVTFVAPAAHGDEASLPGAHRADRVYQLNAVSVLKAPSPAPGTVTGTVAALGDSITDAGGASFDGHGRWTDVLARRLQADPATAGLGLVNLATSGGRVARDRTGPSALSRLDHDVLSLPNLRTLIVFIGVNDLGMMVRERPVTPQNRAAVVDEVIEGYRQIVLRAHMRGARVLVIPILPYGGVTRADYLADPAAQEARHAINAWARAPGHFDAVIDLAPLMSDPAHPDNLAPRFDRGDQLHPNAQGQEAMGAAIPLDLVAK